MIDFIQYFFNDYMKLEEVEVIEIMRVYCIFFICNIDLLKLCFIYVYLLRYIDR